MGTQAVILCRKSVLHSQPSEHVFRHWIGVVMVEQPREQVSAQIS